MEEDAIIWCLRRLATNFGKFPFFSVIASTFTLKTFKLSPENFPCLHQPSFFSKVSINPLPAIFQIKWNQTFSQLIRCFLLFLSKHVPPKKSYCWQLKIIAKLMFRNNFMKMKRRERKMIYNENYTNTL